MTLNSVMPLILRCFVKFGKPAFQHKAASARIELIDRMSASVTQKFARLPQCNDFSVTFF